MNKISKKTLKQIERSMKNMKKGKVSRPVDVKAANALFEMGKSAKNFSNTVEQVTAQLVGCESVPFGQILYKTDLTFKNFSAINRLRCETHFHKLDEWTPSDWAVALAGECCNFIKKIKRGDKIDKKEVGKEIADIVTYADLLAQRHGFSLEEILVEKFNEVSDRVKSGIKL